MKQQQRNKENQEVYEWIVDGEDWKDAWANHINQLWKMTGNNEKLNQELADLIRELKDLTRRMAITKFEELKTK